MKKKTAILLVGALALTAVLSGCGKNKEATEAANESVESEDPEGKAKNSDDAEEEEKEEEKETAAADKKVGVFLPSAADDSRWALDGESFQTALEGDGYDAEIFFADEDSDTQVSQIQSILDDEKTSALVIAPVDAYGLNDVLEQAYEKSIPVISYDQLIMDTDKINYYVTFDTRKAGKMVGDSIIKKMDLEKAREEKRTLTIEFLMGSPDDRDALFFYNGVMEKLQEYFELEKSEGSFSDLGLIFQTTVLGFKIAEVERRRALIELSKRYHVNVYSNSDVSDLLRIQYCGSVDYWSELPQVFRMSKINLNFTIPNIKSGIPLRVWDVLGAGGFLMTNYQAEIPYYFKEGEDLVCFDGINDLCEKAEYYLAHEEERLAIAENGYRKVREHHNYIERINTMLDIIEENENQENDI